MATRAVLQCFERYQKERVAFVSSIAEMAKSPQVKHSHMLLVGSHGKRAAVRLRRGAIQRHGVC